MNLLHCLVLDALITALDDLVSNQYVVMRDPISCTSPGCSE